MAKAKTKKVELTFEEQQMEGVKRDLKRLQEDFECVPEPTYKYNIGDKVDIGNLKDKLESLKSTVDDYLDNPTDYED